MLADNLAGRVGLDISGIGLIVYSPSSANHISEGEDYLSSRFIEPEDVLPHVYSGSIAGFGTGSPGSFEVRVFHGEPPPGAVAGAEFRLRMCLKVSDGEIYVRDLYELLDWCGECPAAQRVRMANGNYRLTLLSRFPDSRILGDDQVIDIYFEPVSVLPELKFDGVPMLGPLD